ncbi:hypothetical protein C8R44DRAFT_869924 [Mycena epipterygia]|nr:hypothetical protein C8R44DRAFT_869924 [Mycena epipterygia]
MSHGDIVIQVESTQFRVHRDSLSNHSSVFGDMFSLPQSPNEATVEGCPIVHLTGDSVQDVEIILAAFYDPYHNKPSQPFHVVAAMLRLGRK